MKTIVETFKIYLLVFFCLFLASGLRAQPMISTGDNAVITSQTVPTDMDKEHVYTLQYTVKNTGSTTWTMGNYQLKIYVTSDQATDNSKWLIPSVDVPNDVAPGSEVVISTKVTAWVDDGNYSFSAQMSRNEAPFGEISQPVVVNIH